MTKAQPKCPSQLARQSGHGKTSRNGPAPNHARDLNYDARLSRSLVHARAKVEGLPTRQADLDDSAPIGYATINDSGCIQRINFTGAQLLGTSSHNLIGQPLLTFIARSDRGKYLKHLYECRSRRERVSIELALDRKERKRPIFVELVTVLTSGPKSRTEVYKSAFIDITFRKRAEQVQHKAHLALEQRVQERTAELNQADAALQTEMFAHKKAELAHARLAAIVESSSDAILSIALNGTITSWNKGAERTYGYAAEEIIGRPISTLFPHGRPDEFRQAAEGIQRGEVVEPFETMRLAKKGRRIDVFLTLSPIKDEAGRVVGISHIARDITWRKRAQKTMRENEKNLTDFFEQSPLGLLWVNSNGRIQRVNQAVLELLGCSPEECLGQSISEFHADREAAKSTLTRLARNEVLRNVRTRLRRKDGSIRHVLIDANAMWEGGRLTYSRWFVRDITDRVGLEKEILAISEREQERISRDLHDDLCQQLTGIEFLTEALAAQLAVHSTERAADAREIAKMLRQAMKHARDLAHGLSPLHLENKGLLIALAELAAKTQRMFGVKCSFCSQSAAQTRDATAAIHLYRIAQEAVTNAVKHAKPQRIDISLARNKHQIALTVQDDGMGIGIKSKRRKRTGMGLRIMQYRAGVIGGSLTVQRDANGGTKLVCSVKDQICESDVEERTPNGAQAHLRRR